MLSHPIKLQNPLITNISWKETNNVLNFLHKDSNQGRLILAGCEQSCQAALKHAYRNEFRTKVFPDIFLS